MAKTLFFKTRSLGSWCCVALVMATCLYSAPSYAVQRALLVGVSELVNQPQALWLQAPRNDVILMRDTLLGQGFKAENISVLADGVSGATLPETARIHDALGRILDESNAGDTVVLYFSGHGTRTQDASKTYQEPDALAENFLARDARGIVANTTAGAAIDGGIKDVEFGAWIKSFLAKDVFVWSLFDTCSAASLTRSGSNVSNILSDDVRFRGVKVTDLAPNKNNKPNPISLHKSDYVSLPKEASPKAQYIAFFASESHQLSPEMRLPRKQYYARQHGLLTWAVAEAFQHKPETWRQLYQGVLNAYSPVISELHGLFPNAELPSPVAEGDLDFKIFSPYKSSQIALPSWPAQRIGTSLVLKSGWLDGLESDQLVNVMASKNDGTVLAAEARMGMVKSTAGRLSVPAVLEGSGNIAAWSISPLSEPASVSLRVRADNAVSINALIAYPASIKRVSDAPFDAQVSLAPTGGYSLQAAPELVSSSHLNQVVLVDNTALQDRLADLARWKWISRVVSVAKKMDVEGFSATLEVMDNGHLIRTDRLYGASTTKPLNAKETANIIVRNASGQSIDLLIVVQDQVGKLHAIYPENLNETNRFEQGTRLAHAMKRFSLPVNKIRSGGRLVVIAGLAQPLSQPRLFGVNLKDNISNVRLRGQLNADKDRQVFSSMLQWGDDAPLKK
jgi:Caspase domain